MLSSIWQDLRFGLRVLAKRMSYTTLGISTLALGIAVTTAIFAFVDAVLLKPLPYPDADRIVRVIETRPSGEDSWISTLNFLDWKRESTAFEHLAAVQQGTATVTGREEPLPVRVSRVSADFFDVFGISPYRGRFFAAGEDEPGSDRVALLSYSIWQREFGGTEELVGDTISLDGTPYAVIGILPPDSAFDRSGIDVWHPLALQSLGANRSYRWINAAFGLLRPDVDLERASAEMETLGTALANDYPDTNRGWSVSVRSYADTLVAAPLRTSSLVLLAAVGGLLLICCTNLACLILSRAVSRSDEISVRMSLGATTTRIARQLVFENLLLVAGGTLVGVILAFVGVIWIRRLIPAGVLPSETGIALDARVLAFTVTIAILTGLTFGLIPYLRLYNGDRHGNLAPGARGTTAGHRARRFLNAFVVAQVALSVVLALSATLLMRSFVSLISVDTGFESARTLTMRLPVPGFPPGSVYDDPEQFRVKIRETLAAVETVPGVADAAMTSALPLTDCCLYLLNVRIEGKPPDQLADQGSGYFKIVTPSYTSTMNLRLVSGRLLTDQDDENSRPVILINERLADRYFPGENPVGQRIMNPEIIPGRTERGDLIPWEIVGIVANEATTGLDDDSSAVAYASYEQSPAYFANLIVKTSGDPLLLERPVRAALNAIDPAQSILDVRTMDQIQSTAADRSRIQASLLTAFTVIAVVFAAVGLFGVLTYGVSRRTREIGIRSAVGATPLRLLIMVMREGLVVTGAGLAIGLSLAYITVPLISSIIFEVSPHDPYSFSFTAVAFIVVAVAASLAPAFRAARLDANTVLRGD